MWIENLLILINPTKYSIKYKILSKQIPECNEISNNSLASCIIDNKEKLVNTECKRFIKNIAALVFSDYRLINNFYSDCASDVETYKCGRLENDADEPTQQGKTLECLSLQFKRLQTNCKKQILRITELQSDDFHLDRSLYFACREDRERFCEDTVSGEGIFFHIYVLPNFLPNHPSF
jgi:Golgi apparatus protein 1